jgi:hypothetical protein
MPNWYWADHLKVPELEIGPAFCEESIRAGISFFKVPNFAIL